MLFSAPARESLLSPILPPTYIKTGDDATVDCVGGSWDVGCRMKVVGAAVEQSVKVFQSTSYPHRHIMMGWLMRRCDALPAAVDTEWTNDEYIIKGPCC